MTEYRIQATDKQVVGLQWVAAKHGLPAEEYLQKVISPVLDDYARQRAAATERADLAIWQKVKDSELVKNAVEVELGVQAEAAAAPEETVPPEEPKA